VNSEAFEAPRRTPSPRETRGSAAGIVTPAAMQEESRMGKLLASGGMSLTGARAAAPRVPSQRSAKPAKAKPSSPGGAREGEPDSFEAWAFQSTSSRITDQAVVSSIDEKDGVQLQRRRSFESTRQHHNHKGHAEIGGSGSKLRVGEIDGTVVQSWFVKGECTTFNCGFIKLVNPNAMLSLMWLLFGVTCMFYEAVVIPVYLAFEVDATGFWKVLTELITVYFLFDILVTFFTAYTKSGGVMVVRLESIAVHYSRSWLFFDILAAMPWEWLSINNPETKITRITKVMRFMRLIPRLMKLKYRLQAVSAYFEGSRVFLFIYGIVRIVAILLFVSHWLSCAWYAVGGVESKRPSWRDTAAEAYVEDFQEKSQQYVWALYFTIATMTTIGYGDISAFNFNEACFGLFLLPIASVGFAAMMGTLTDLIATINTSGRLLSERKMKLSHYLKWRKVPKALEVRLREYLLYLWDLKQDYDSYEEDLKAKLPSVLKEELCFHLYGKTLLQAPFLEFMREFPVCMQQLCSMLTVEHRQRGDHLFRVGDRNDSIQLIRTGAVWLSLNQNLYSDPAKLPPRGVHLMPEAAKSVAKGSTDFVQNVVFGKDHYNGEPHVAHDLMSIDDTLMTDAGRRLRLRDVAMRRSARLIQTVWRLRRDQHPTVKPTSSTGRKPRGKFGVNWMRSHLVHAPAYFGEACLWVPLDKWENFAPTYKYAARCQTLVEQVTIKRSSLQTVIDHFSPWLGDRFEFFREAVAESMQEFSSMAEAAPPAEDDGASASLDVMSNAHAAASKQPPHAYMATSMWRRS
jgi:hypothetical protein